MAETIRVSDISKYVGQEVTVKGWVYNRTDKGKLCFLLVRDGSGFVQCVAFKGDLEPEVFDRVSEIARPVLPKPSEGGHGIIEATGETQLLPWYQLEPGPWTAPEPGPYTLMFLDAGGQEIVGYSHPFTVAVSTVITEPALFAFKVPFPVTTTQAQIRRNSDNALLAQIAPGAVVEVKGPRFDVPRSLRAWRTGLRAATGVRLSRCG